MKIAMPSLETVEEVDTEDAESEENPEERNSNSKEIPSSSLRKKFKDCKIYVKSGSLKRQLFPFLAYAKGYGLKPALGDGVASLTLTLTIIPMVISFAALAGLPLQYGLYSSILPGVIYALLGHCPEVTIGPTAVLAIITNTYANGDPTKTATLTFLSGIILILGGIFNLGFLVNFVSRPVLAGFLSANCIQVASSQLTGLLGLSRSPKRGPIHTVKWVFTNLKQIRPVDTSIGLISIGILLFLRRLKDMKCCEGPDDQATKSKVLKKMKWFISIARNSIILIITSVIAFLLSEVFLIKDVLKLTGDIPRGAPVIEIPWKYEAVNGTSPSQFLGMIEDLGGGLFAIPFIGYVQLIAIIKHYSSIHTNREVYPSQEMVTLGLVNACGGFVGSMPCTASLSRCAVNAASGVNTTFGGIFTSILILISCICLTPLLAFIPRSALAAVIIAAVVFTFDADLVQPLWKHKKAELIPYFVTFFVGVFYRLEVALSIGIMVHLLFVFYISTKPKPVKEIRKVHNFDLRYMCIKMDKNLYFPSVDNIRAKIFEAIKNSKDKTPLPIVLDLILVSDIDFTTAKALRNIENPLRNSGHQLYFIVQSTKVKKVLEEVDSAKMLSYENLRASEVNMAMESSKKK